LSKSWPDFTLLVDHKGILPVVGKEFQVKSCLTDEISFIKVKAIHALRWNDNGDLVVEIDGIKSVKHGA
jgi:hypothetical protein